MDHNRIIARAAGAVLAPHGLFRKGRSRIWVDDCGWFLTLAEFQPSAWEQGSYLNVGVHFLWSRQMVLTYDCGGRMDGWVPFTGEEGAFARGITDLAERALERVLSYRALRDPALAKGELLQDARWEARYDWLMVCALTEDPRTGALCRQLLEDGCLRPALRAELTGEVLPLLTDPGGLRAAVEARIAAQRAFWRGRGMGRLR